jgi:hypothetical protein
LKDAGFPDLPGTGDKNRREKLLARMMLFSNVRFIYINFPNNPVF